LLIAAIDFLSFIEPPGCITASTPTSISFSMPSGKGKKASEAATEFLIFLGRNFKALPDAILQLSNLLGWPEPIPIVDFLFTRTIELDLTNLQTLKANFKLFN